jgi:putative ABC transport system permease protein
LKGSWIALQCLEVRKVTFKDFAVKNFKHNFKTYSAFYICSTFTVAVFFIFTALFYNKTVSDFLKDAFADLILYMSLILTFVFAVFFISYVHTSMKKRRSKEFGLLMTFGLTAKDIGKIIVIEDSLLSGISIISGVLVGALSSRLVHMFVNRLLALDIPYSLSFNCFTTTIAAFVFIFSVVILWGWFGIRKLEISKLLKEDRETEYFGDGKVTGLLFGIITVLIMMVVAFIALNDRQVAMDPKITLPSVILGLMGTYLLIANILPKLLKLLKKRRNFYNRNMIMLSEARYSMGKNKKLIYLSTILCAVIIPCFSIAQGMSFNIKSMINSVNGPDVEYIEAFHVNDFSDVNVRNLISEENMIFKSKQDIKCIFINVDGLSKEDNLPIVAMSASTFNTIYSKNTSVQKGTARLSGDAFLLPNIKGNSLMIHTRNDILKLSLLKPEGVNVISIGEYEIHKFTIILNDEDYIRLEKQLPVGMAGVIHQYRINDWENSGGLIGKLTALSESTKKQNGVTGAGLSLGISGKYPGYIAFKKVNSIIIFVCIFLSLLFYFASILVLLLRQFEALERAKRKYRQLRKIGITKKEFGKNIFNEIRILFLTPVLFGTILSYAFILITIGLFGIPESRKLLINASLLISAYIVLQFVFCRLSGRAFLNKVTEL